MKKASIGCLVILVVMALLSMIGWCVGTRPQTGERTQATSARATGMPLDAAVVAATPEQLVRTFGEPSEHYSSETEVPRPPIVTRMFTYGSERVRVIYVADAKMGDPPPYKGWRLVGFTDPSINVRLEPTDAMERLRHRAKQ